mgnify:CR=1 FL=1|tara:strand:- start:147 stop:806 length:660 start_codon:yes stop_codon:yes gene_type:complete
MSAKRLPKETLEEMKQLRQKGLTYEAIAIKLNISKGTICYHLAPGQKEKTSLRCARRYEQRFIKKVDNFFDRKTRPKKIVKDRRPERRWSYKVRSIFRDKNESTKGLDMKTRSEEVKNYFWPKDNKDEYGNEFPRTTCRYSGVPINFEADIDTLEYATFDHKIAVSKGGPNEVTNCQPLQGIVNDMKRALSQDVFFKWIYKIVHWHTYKEWEKKYEEKT